MRCCSPRPSRRGGLLRRAPVLEDSSDRLRLWIEYQPTLRPLAQCGAVAFGLKKASMAISESVSRRRSKIVVVLNE